MQGGLDALGVDIRPCLLSTSPRHSSPLQRIRSRRWSRIAKRCTWLDITHWEPSLGRTRLVHSRNVWRNHAFGNRNSATRIQWQSNSDRGIIILALLHLQRPGEGDQIGPAFLARRAHSLLGIRKSLQYDISSGCLPLLPLLYLRLHLAGWDVLDIDDFLQCQNLSRSFRRMRHEHRSHSPPYT